MVTKTRTASRMSATAGWGMIAPHRGYDREKLIRGCGRRCFLLPDQRKFPICRRCQSDRCNCRPECSALRAARIRAAQWGYQDVYRRAKQMFEDQGCVWTASRGHRRDRPRRR